MMLKKTWVEYSLGTGLSVSVNHNRDIHIMDKEGRIQIALTPEGAKRLAEAIPLLLAEQFDQPE